MVVREFLSALLDRRTYSPRRNLYAVFGFLWGLPIPAFGLWLMDGWPARVLFLLHPFFFFVIFGAMGTVRHRKDEQIRKHVAELEDANARLKELDRLKAEFMANVTHELKTPLVAIRGYNESIFEERFGPLTDKQREGLRVSVRNIDRLQKLIEELLEFERIDAGELKLSPSDFDIVALVRATLRNFQPQIDEKRLEVRLLMPESLPVHADREKISHVLLNLISNAIKFSPAGTPIGVNVRAGDAGQSLVTVWDQGPGIPASAQKHLFTRFWQADGSARRKHGGTGLGLAICKGILDAHRCPIQVISTEGTGTMVHFELPMARVTV